jgi:nicotinate-nucleotide adenylyltransferase
MKRNIGILGGTFDPVHWGHLSLAAAAKTQASLDELLWIPAYFPPHKGDRYLAAFHHRLAMLELAIAEDSTSTISTIEANRSFPSYSADTWYQLQQQYPAARWFWIVGTDTLRTLSHWYRREELVRHCHWLVAPRLPPESDYASIPEIKQQARQIACQTRDRLARESLPLHWQLLDTIPIQISSTQVRNAARLGQSLQSLVPEAVANYITSHRLYEKG